ncbi:MAG: hypothetical protein LBB60_05515, partial [Desulfovibrio sp.]|nr:hypothetical protein [Desulfovibrio sp.]
MSPATREASWQQNIRLFSAHPSERGYFLAVEPLLGEVTLQITEKRTRKEWAEFIKHLAEDRYPHA